MGDTSAGMVALVISTLMGALDTDSGHCRSSDSAHGQSVYEIIRQKAHAMARCRDSGLSPIDCATASYMNTSFGLSLQSRPSYFSNPTK